MNTASKQTLHTIEQIVKPIPIGTNLGLLQLMWAMITGSFLRSRGAINTALGLVGFEDDEINRSWHALRYGTWLALILPAFPTGYWDRRPKNAWAAQKRVGEVELFKRVSV